MELLNRMHNGVIEIEYGVIQTALHEFFTTGYD